MNSIMAAGTPAIGNWNGLTQLYEFSTMAIGEEGSRLSPFESTGGLSNLVASAQQGASTAIRIASGVSQIASNPSRLLGAITSAGGMDTVGLSPAAANALGMAGSAYSSAYAAANGGNLSNALRSLYGTASTVTGLDAAGMLQRATAETMASGRSELGPVAESLLQSGLGAGINVMENGGVTADISRLHGAAQSVGADQFLSAASGLQQLRATGGFDLNFSSQSLVAGAGAFRNLSAIGEAFGGLPEFNDIFAWLHEATDLSGLSSMLGSDFAHLDGLFNTLMGASGSPMRAAQAVAGTLFPTNPGDADGLNRVGVARQGILRHAALEAAGYGLSAGRATSQSLAMNVALRQAARNALDLRGAWRANSEAHQLFLRELTVVSNLFSAGNALRSARSISTDRTGFNIGASSMGGPTGNVANRAEIDAQQSAGLALAEAERIAAIAQAMHDDLTALTLGERQRETLEGLIAWSQDSTSGADAHFLETRTAASNRVAELITAGLLPAGTYTPFEEVEALLRSLDTTGHFDADRLTPDGTTTTKDASAAQAALQAAQNQLALVPTSFWDTQPCPPAPIPLTDNCGARAKAWILQDLAVTYAGYLAEAKYADHMRQIALEAETSIANLDASRQAYAERWGISPDSARSEVERLLGTVPDVSGPLTTTQQARNTDVDRRLSQIAGDPGNTSFISGTGQNAAIPVGYDAGEWQQINAWAAEHDTSLSTWQTQAAAAEAAGLVSGEFRPPPLPEGGMFSPAGSPTSQPGNVLQ